MPRPASSNWNRLSKQAGHSLVQDRVPTEDQGQRHPHSTEHTSAQILVSIPPNKPPLRTRLLGETGPQGLRMGTDVNLVSYGARKLRGTCGGLGRGSRS